MQGMKGSGIGPWVVFAVLSLGSVFSFFLRLSTGVLGPPLMDELQMDARQLGALAGAFFYAFAAVQIPVGLALDSFSPKRVMIATLALAVAGCVLFGLADRYEIALWGRVLMGLGMSSMLMGSMTLIHHGFRPDRFAFLSGVVLSLGNIGGVLAAAPLVYAVSLVGWRNCFLGTALLLALLCVAIAALVKGGPDGSRGAPAGSRRALLKRNLFSSSRAVFTDRHFWFISLSAFVRYGSLITIQGFLGTLYLIDVLGYSLQTAANMLATLSVGYLIGSPLLGRLSDSILSRKRVMVAALFVYLGCISFFLFDIDSPGLWYTVFFALGFFSSMSAVSYAHVKELFPEGMAGFALTSTNLFTIGGVAVGQKLIGWVVSRFPQRVTGYAPEAYHAAFALLFTACIAAFLLYVFVRDTRPLTAASGTLK